MSSSRTGLRKTDGQRLSPLLGVLCGPFTPTLHASAKHPSNPVRRGLDVLITVAGLHRGGKVSTRNLSAGGIPARLFTPEGVGADAPLLVYFHGGGFVVGSINSHAQACRFIAQRGACKVLSVGYRKAPEHRFPAAVDDCTAAFRWAAAHAAELGVNPARIAVGGDSAGGNAAIGVCLNTLGEEHRPCAAWLLYPVVDADFDAWPSDKLFEKGPLLSAACVRDMFANYCQPGQEKNPQLSPINSEQLGELPPIYLATAGMDPLRDQGEAFADRARAAGAKVELRRYDSLPHAFINLLIDPGARSAAEESVRGLRALFA
jgi:acetyl esterase